MKVTIKSHFPSSVALIKFQALMKFRVGSSNHASQMSHVVLPLESVHVQLAWAIPSLAPHCIFSVGLNLSTLERRNCLSA